MKREHNILALFVLGIIALTFILGIVAAQTTPAEDLKAGFKSVFEKTLTGADVWLIKFLAWFLICLIIFAISDSLPFLGGKTFLSFVISGIIAYLSVAFLAPAELFAAMQSYSALGVTLTAIIPFIIILAFAYKLVEKPTPGNILAQKLALGIFVAFLTYKVFALWWDTTAAAQTAWAYAMAIYLPVLAVTVLMLIFSKTIRNFIFSTKVKGYIEMASTLNKEDMLAQAIMLREKAGALERTGAREAAINLKNAATRIEKEAASMS